MAEQQTSQLHRIVEYFTGRSDGNELDRYQNPDLYDRDAYGALCLRDNLARGTADAIDLSTGESSASILEIAAGTGILSIELARRGHEVTALDLFQQPLKALEQKSVGENASENVRPVRADMNNPLPFADNSFELVTSLRATRYIRDFKAWLEEAHRVLQPDGTLLLPVFAIDTIPWKRHSNLGIRQPTTLSGVTKAVAISGLHVDTNVNGRYASLVNAGEGDREVPSYYRPKFLVARKMARSMISV